jgi:hypothetical protein
MKSRRRIAPLKNTPRPNSKSLALCDPAASDELAHNTGFKMSIKPNVRFGSLADICNAKAHVRFTPNSDRESGLQQKVMSALGQKRT